MHSAWLDSLKAGRTDRVLDLLTAGVDARTCDADGTRLIQWCAYFGDVSAVRLLLQHGEDLRALGADLGLNGAAFHGHWQLCQFLLQAGAPVNGVATATGETPLHSALSNDDRLRYDLVLQVLLAAGADPDVRTIAGVETGAFMRDARTRGESPLHRAAAFGSLRSIQLLLDAGAALDAIDAQGDTPLSWASWYRRPPDVLRALCFGPFSIRSSHLGLRAHLLGDPAAAG